MKAEVQKPGQTSQAKCNMNMIEFCKMQQMLESQENFDLH